MDDITLHNDTKYLFHWAANLNGVLALGKKMEKHEELSLKTGYCRIL